MTCDTNKTFSVVDASSRRENKIKTDFKLNWMFRTNSIDAFKVSFQLMNVFWQNVQHCKCDWNNSWPAFFIVKSMLIVFANGIQYHWYWNQTSTYILPEKSIRMEICNENGRTFIKWVIQWTNTKFVAASQVFDGA